MDTATNESTSNNNKRFRIDPKAITNHPAMNKPTQRSTTGTKATTPLASKTTPTMAATTHIDDFTESLFPQLTTILPRISKEHLTLLIQRTNKENTIAKWNNTIATMAESSTTIDERFPAFPRSANIKFYLSVPDNVKQNPAFVALDADTKAYLQEVKINLTKRIADATKISLEVTNQEINASLASALYNFTIAYLKATTTTPMTDETQLSIDAHTIVNSILDHDADRILKYFGGTVSTFREGYMKIHSLDSLPAAEILQIAQSPARRGRSNNNNNNTATSATTDDDDEDPTGRNDSIGYSMLGLNSAPPSPPRHARATRTKRHTQILSVKHLIETLLVRPYEIFLTQTDNDNRLVALKKLEKTLFTAKATDTAAMLVDNEATIAPQQLQELVQKSVDKATTPLRKEIDRLTEQLSKQRLSPSKTKRGRSKTPNRKPSPGKRKTGASTKRNQSSPATRRRKPKNDNRNDNKKTTDNNSDQAAVNNSGTNKGNASKPRSRSNSRSRRNNKNSKTGSNRQRRQSGRS
jgi:hypothetical protein